MLSSLRNPMRRSREMGLAGMSHHPCRDQKTTDPEKPSFPSFPHHCPVSTRQRRVRDREPSKLTGRSNSSRVCGLLRGDPLPPWKKRDERHGRRTALPSIIDDPACIYGAKHVLKPVPPIGSANRMRHRIRVPTRLPVSLFPSLPTLRLVPLFLFRRGVARSNVRFLQGIAPRRYRYLFPAGWKRRLPRLGHEIHGCGPESLLTYAIFQAWDASSRYASSRINVITGEILYRTEYTVEGLKSIRFFFFKAMRKFRETNVSRWMIQVRLSSFRC